MGVVNIQGIKSTQNIYKEKKIESVVDLLKPAIKSNKKENNSIGDLLIEIEEKQSKVKKIAQKIARGESIDSEEYKYIKETNPHILDKANEANNLRKRLEHEISSAKTKEEALTIIGRAKKMSLQSINSNDGNSILMQKVNLEAIEKAKINSNINFKEDKDKNIRESIDKLV